MRVLLGSTTDAQVLIRRPCPLPRPERRERKSHWDREKKKKWRLSSAKGLALTDGREDEAKPWSDDIGNGILLEMTNQRSIERPTI